MKYIILALIALVISVGVLVSLADDTPSEADKSDSVVAVGISGQVGVKISDNLCINPFTGAPEVCF